MSDLEGDFSLEGAIDIAFRMETQKKANLLDSYSLLIKLTGWFFTGLRLQ